MSTSMLVFLIFALATAMCGMQMYFTKGASGIGWFAFCLVVLVMSISSGE